MTWHKTMGVAFIVAMMGAQGSAGAQEAPAPTSIAQLGEADGPQADPAPVEQGASATQTPSEASVAAPAPEEHANQCRRQRPERRGLEILLVPFDFGRQGLRALRGIFTDC